MTVSIDYEKSSIEDAPGYIRLTVPLTLPKHFAPFEINKTMIPPKSQMEWYRDILSELDRGWLSVVCGDIEYSRMFAYHLCSKYVEAKQRAVWKRITTVRWMDKPKAYASVLALDALITFDGQVDSVRFGNAFDMCSEFRGKSSVIVIAGGMTPEEVCQKAHLRPDYLFYLRTKQHREH